MANGHGGKRAGAGRPRKAEKYAGQIAAAEDRIADRLLDRVAALEMLAEGGFEEVEKVFEPAGLIQITKELIGEDGRSMNVKELAFPHLAPEKLVCVQQKVRIAAPDRKANEGLLDRILGRPTQSIEAEVEHNVGDELRAAYAAAVAKIYGQGIGESGGDGS